MASNRSLISFGAQQSTKRWALLALNRVPDIWIATLDRGVNRKVGNLETTKQRIFSVRNCLSKIFAFSRCAPVTIGSEVFRDLIPLVDVGADDQNAVILMLAYNFLTISNL